MRLEPSTRAYAQLGRPGMLADARWIDIPTHVDGRGALSTLESERELPFEIRRVYFLHGLSGARGGHAHRFTHQVIVPLAGSFEVELRDAASSRRFVLEDIHRGLYVVPMLFLRLDRCDPDCRVLVLASTHYDPASTIRSWDEYVAEVVRAT